MSDSMSRTGKEEKRKDEVLSSPSSSSPCKQFKLDEGAHNLENSGAQESCGGGGGTETAVVISPTMDAINDEEDDCFQEAWSGAEDSNNCDANADGDGMEEDDSLFDDDDYEEDIEMDSSLDDASGKKDQDEESVHFEILSPEQLVQCMASSIQQTNGILQLPSTSMRLLLNHFKWDKEKLLETFYTAGQQDQFFKSVGMVNPLTLGSSSSLSSSTLKNQEAAECQICYLEKPPSKMFGMKCGHLFCTDCWTEYLTSRISDSGSCLQVIPCAEHNCPVLVDDGNVMKLLSDSTVKLKYQRLITNSFVQCNRLIKWCPSPGCCNAIKLKDFDGRSCPVICSCMQVWCFKCQNLGSHVPVSCEMLKKWLKKCEDDSETSNWIMANTKECPKCGASIEKNGGCNAMKCKHCNTHFCWACMKYDGSHYDCNRYQEPKDDNIRNKSRQALNRYLFYFNRFKNHDESLKLEKKLYAQMTIMMEQLHKHLNSSWVEVQILKKAVDVLCECRETLMNTYIFAYYVDKTNEKDIFEDNQHDLEAATEKLSGYLEREIGDDELNKIKLKVQDMVSYCAGRRQVLITHVREGHEKESWTFNQG